MHRLFAIVLVLLGGCSTAPLADVLDHSRPGRIEPGPYIGGVTGPTQTITGPPLTSSNSAPAFPAPAAP